MLLSVRCIFLAGAVIVSGCVSSQETYLADGRKGHVVSCTPTFTGGLVGTIASSSTSWGQCYQKAGELCGARGYTVLQQVGESGARADMSRDGGSASTTNNRMMIVQCKDGS